MEQSSKKIHLNDDLNKNVTNLNNFHYKNLIDHTGTQEKYDGNYHNNLFVV